MMRTKYGLVAAAAFAVLQFSAPATAQATPIYSITNMCTATTLNVCMDFDLTYDSGVYTLVSKYASSNAAAGQQGYITAVGIYNVGSSPLFNLTVTSIAVSNGDTWCSPDLTGSQYCNNLNELNGNGTTVLLGGAKENETGISGLQVNDFVTITFTTPYDLAGTDFNSDGTVGLRAHVQSFGPNPDCSMKPDTRADGYVFSVSDACGGNVVPEPASMVLLATGLLGLVGFSLLRRAA